MATKLVIMTNPTIKTIILIVSNEIEISPMIVAVNAIGIVIVIVIEIVIVTVIVIVPATTATMPAPSLTIKPTNPALDLVIAPEMMTLSPMKMNNHF